MSTLIVRDLSRVDYEKTWQDMRDFTDNRTENTTDEIWLLEHPPVFTQGLAGKPEHLLNAHTIPVVQTDRGGQITYHGPGQLVTYVLFDLKRQNIFARDLVRRLENSVIEVLKQYNIDAISRCDAPGIYIHDAKICSIGLRVRKNCSYHGIALNVDMDLAPFQYINPCGHKGMKMVQLKSLVSTVTFTEIKKILAAAIAKNFGYNEVEFLLGKPNVTKHL